MKIGKVAEKLGIPASTIRYYEKVGLIDPQRRVSGQREFDQQTLLALRIIKLAQAVGFTLDETKTLRNSYTQGDQSLQSRNWIPFAKAKRAEIRQQIQQLQEMDQILSDVISCQCVSLESCVEQTREKPRFSSNDDDRP